MTSIILVSHSEKIAEGTKDLLSQMASGVNVVAQGGINGEIGTSFDDIHQLLNGLNDDAICFYDIGSAEMNLDMAIEMYNGKNQMIKVDAPIVEGSFTDAVKLSVGGTLEDTIEEVKNHFS